MSAVIAATVVNAQESGYAFLHKQGNPAGCLGIANWKFKSGNSG
jgi:hypothetical protein